MLKAYIATGLGRAADHNLVRDALAKLEVECTYDWTVHGAVFSHGLERLREVAALEAGGVKDADVVVVLLPGGRGTHAELGMAIALGKPVILHSMNPRSDFGAEETTCAFYHHPRCTQLSEFNCRPDVGWFNTVAAVAHLMASG